MTSRRLLSVLAVVIWVAVVFTSASRALPHHRTTENSYTHDSPAASCSDLHIHFRHSDAVMQSEERTFTRSEAPTLRIVAESNGGVQVQGWDQETYKVTLCKAAEAGSEADSVLSSIHLAFQNGELGVSGPFSHERWSAHLLIRAPKAAAFDLHVKNGPVGLYRVDGILKVRAQNGPVTVAGCTGELDLSAQNGPITLEDNSGKQRVQAENGPVTLSLSGSSWEGAGIEARANNGPVKLRIPSGYKSGVVLEAEGHSPIRCDASVCSEGRKTWDDDLKRIEFGSGPTLVRVSTNNGPVSVD